MKNFITITRDSLLRFLFCMTMIFTLTFLFYGSLAYAQSNFTTAISLSESAHGMNIGEEFQLRAFSTTFKQPSFRSSDSSIASVDYWGHVRAKKAGKVKITATLPGGGQASCTVVVYKTEIAISRTSATLTCNSTSKLWAACSTDATIFWRSSNSSIASIDQNGVINAKKPGTVTITASADGSKVTCKVTVKKK